MKIKKYLLLVSMLAVMLSLAGCGKEEKKGFDYDEHELTLMTMDYFQSYSNFDSDYLEYFLNSATDFEKSIVKGIDQARNNDKVGKFEDYTYYFDTYGNNVSGFNPEKVNARFTEDVGSVMVTITNKAEDRDVDISVKFTENDEYYIMFAKYASQMTADEYVELLAKNNNMDVDQLLKINGVDSAQELYENEIAEILASKNVSKYIPEEMVVSAVYSKGELMKQAGMNTLLGMGTVFCVLIFISFIISLFKFLPALTAKKAKVPEPKKEAPKADKPVSSVAPKKEENLMNDAELVAVITAAIYAATGTNASLATSKDKLVVRSIKRVKK